MTTKAKVARHKTALRRPELSRPLRLALQDGLISKSTTVFDYGCGRGGDVRQLRNLDIDCEGWDPTYRSETPQRSSDVVNLGYVVNVIEDPEERAQALGRAWQLSERLLVVAAQLRSDVKKVNGQELNDGFLTGAGTFQKYFEQRELREWIDGCLQVSSIPAAPGVFYAFRDEQLRQSFLASRFHRASSTPQLRKSEVLFEAHSDLLRPLMDFVAARGRLPEDEEFGLASPVSETFGSIKRAFSVVRRVTGKEQWDQIRNERRDDLRVYLGLSRFEGRPKFSRLPRELQLDVRALFGSYKKACESADDLLFSVGDLERINRACLDSELGKLTPTALYVHTSALPRVSPTLRAYEACARGFVGVVEGANIVKLHRHKPKVSYLTYPEFDSDPHPELKESLVVFLRNRDFARRNYEQSENPPILHRKEEFVGPDHPKRQVFEKLTRAEVEDGLYEDPSTIGTRRGWNDRLTQAGISYDGHRLVRFS